MGEKIKMTNELESQKIQNLIDKCRFNGYEKSVLEVYLQSLQENHSLGGSIGNDELNNKRLREDVSQSPLFHPDALRGSDSDFKRKLRKKDIFNGEIISPTH